MFRAGWTLLWFCAMPMVSQAAASPAVESLVVTSAPGGKAGFTLASAAATGVFFTNYLRGDLYLTNAVAHNGSGVAIGDIDQDGFPDIYFCNLDGPNQLYRNLGNWKFQALEIGDAACAGQLSTGSVFADLDGDGDLDLLVNGIAAGTRLFLNDGQGRWTESKNSGLADKASPTSMALGDIDGDGDLDLYCAHYIDVMHLADPTTRFALERRDGQWAVSKVNGQSTRMPKWKDRFEALPGGSVRELPEADALYRNDGNGRFTAIQNEPGVFLNEQGEPIPPFRDWGLAVMFRDMNGDRAPDIYVCNDNVSPDRIWMNQGKGTFRAIDPLNIRHTSRSSMGVDFADLDRDGRDDFIVVDMLARETSRRMMQLVKDLPDRATLEGIQSRPAFNRNTLFFGAGDGSFTELALRSGVAASDWSWCPMFLDVDLDGYEDLLISNGFEFDVMDQDSNTAIRTGRLSFDQQKRARQLHPAFRTRNASFRNRGDGTFEPMGSAWGFDQAGVSYGMALGDLDRDGDLDVVINNLNEAASLLRNDCFAPRIAIRLKGRTPNTRGIGARLVLSGGTMPQSQEMIAGGRYMSGDEAVRVFAAEAGKPGRLEVLWADGTDSVITNLQANRAYEVEQTSAHRPESPLKTNDFTYFKDVSDKLGHVHAEAAFDDWARQPHLPHRLSRLGPGLAWFDLDGDGWEELLIGSGRGGKLGIFKNKEGQSFEPVENASTGKGDQSGLVGWHDGKGKREILVGHSNLERPPGEKSDIANISVTGAVIGNAPATEAAIGPLAIADVDRDGDLDLFVGGQFRPGAYPEPVSSVIWINENGQLKLSAPWSAAFQSIGMVSGATFADLDNDADPDLVLAVQWGPMRIFLNDRNQFKEATKRLDMEQFRGGWNSVVAGDFDGDGRLDLAAGNLGRNTYYELYDPPSLRTYYGDFDGNGVSEVIEAFRAGTHWFPLRDLSTLSRGWPELLKKFPTHAAYGAASVPDLIGANHPRSKVLELTHLETTVFMNRTTHFEPRPLPAAAQCSPVFAINTGDFNGDGKEDLFLGQNFFGRSFEISRDDAGRGLWLMGNGQGSFEPLEPSLAGINLPGEQRGAALADFNHDGRVDLAVAQNSSETKLFLNQRAARGVRISLKGPVANPDAVGAHLRLVYGDGRAGPIRAVQAGSGYWSQDSAAQVLGSSGAPRRVWVRWPDGREANIDLEPDVWNVSVEHPQ